MIRMQRKRINEFFSYNRSKKRYEIKKKGSICNLFFYKQYTPINCDYFTINWKANTITVYGIGQKEKPEITMIIPAANKDLHFSANGNSLVAVDIYKKEKEVQKEKKLLKRSANRMERYALLTGTYNIYITKTLRSKIKDRVFAGCSNDPTTAWWELRFFDSMILDSVLINYGNKNCQYHQLDNIKYICLHFEEDKTPILSIQSDTIDNSITINPYRLTDIGICDGSIIINMSDSDEDIKYFCRHIKILNA